MHKQVIFFREMIVSMEDHDDKRRLCEPDTWNLQKHLIVDFIQNVLTKVCYEINLNWVFPRNVALKKHLLRGTLGKWQAF